MNILIFGASGKTGKKLVIQGLRNGHNVTAFVRNPDKLQLWDDNLRIIQGNALNSADVSSAIKGHDVIVSALGDKTSRALFEPSTTVSDAIKNIIPAMASHKVKRLMFIASFGVNKKIFPPEKIVIKTILRNLFADIPKQEELIKASGLDWIIIHPARLVDSPKTEQYQSGENLPIGLFSKISRADVADFIIKNVQNDALIGKTITIRY